MKKRLLNFFLVILCLAGVSKGGLYLITWKYKDQVDLVKNFPASSQVFDRNGVLLYEYIGNIRRLPVDPEKIPDHLVSATLMAEDERFFEHGGFDSLGLIRAFWKNLWARGIVQGGSTLGQQLIKNTILGKAYGYKDKFKEILLSVALDHKFSKKEIINLYLNTIPYGSNAYGVEAASRMYFAKSVPDLQPAESAILAALPKHPTYLSPTGEHLDELVARQKSILNKMLERGYLSEQEYFQALSYPLVFADQNMAIKAPHFVMYVKEQLIKRYGLNRLENGGLNITTTLDYNKQKVAEDLVKNHKILRDKHRADSVGLISIDPKSGEILAMVGNGDYFSDEFGNYNMTTALRQPGSAFKPIVYSVLLEDYGYSSVSTLLDLPRNYSLDSKEPYIPKNYDLKYRGLVSVRQALAMSLNVPAVQALSVIGLDPVLDRAAKMGIYSLKDRSRFGYSLALGGGEMRLLELTSAYAVLANSGQQIDPLSILEIKTFDGKPVEWQKSENKQVIKPETAFQITSILSDTKARAPIFGSRGPLAFNDRQVAAKTGTSQNYRDAWAIGYTPSLVVGVWVGNHDNSPLRTNSPGVSVAGPLWRAYMDSQLEGTKTEEFIPPKDLTKKRVLTFLGWKEDYIAPWQKEWGFNLPAYLLKKDDLQNGVFPNDGLSKIVEPEFGDSLQKP